MQILEDSLAQISQVPALVHQEFSEELVVEEAAEDCLEAVHLHQVLDYLEEVLAIVVLEEYSPLIKINHLPQFLEEVVEDHPSLEARIKEALCLEARVPIKIKIIQPLEDHRQDLRKV